MKKTKLELTWIDKDVRPRLEPRVLLEDSTKSHVSSVRISEADIFDNLLIHGDNLLALKALEHSFSGKVDLVYIDPPYNTGHAFEYYDDGREHSIWLGLMRDRVEMLRRLLAPSGFFACQIDDSEGPYLKVMLDEVFGRSNFVCTFFVQVRYGTKTLAEDNAFQKVIEQCFIYAKDVSIGKPIRDQEEYKLDKFEWEITTNGPSSKVQLGGKDVEIFLPGTYDIRKIPAGRKGLKETWATGSLLKQKGSSGEFLGKYLAPRKDVDGLGCLYKVYGIGEDGLGFRFFSGPKKASATKGKFYSGVPLQRLAELDNGGAIKGKPIPNFYDFAADFGNCRHEGGVDFRSGKKPEKLLWTILKHFTRPGALVLDSFLGSGTTAAVAHKMGRRWIGIELGEHCHTHCRPRLMSVIDGQDSAGITETVGWKGGGGFRYYRLAPSMLLRDKWDQFVINPEFNAPMLAEAVCKLEGFTYAPSDTLYWQQGYSTEQDFIYTTTANLSHDQLQQLSDEVGPDRSLLVVCSAFRGRKEGYSNLTVKKIPQAVLTRCEWGKDDYSLKVENLPKAPAKAGQMDLFVEGGDA